MPEALPRRGPVDASRVVQLLRDRLEAGEQEQGNEGGGFPHVGNDDRNHGNEPLAEPTEVLRDQWDVVVDEAGDDVEHEGPHLGRNHRWDDPWNENRGTDPGSSGGSVHDQREPQADQELERYRANREDERRID